MASVMDVEDDGEPMGSGRRQLQGVLEDLVQQSKEADEKQATDGAEDSAVEEAAKSLVELPNSIKLEDSKRKGFGSPRKRRRRTKKELLATSDESDDETRHRTRRHIPHVMTLFDRRVDLAMFSEATPLYVMCREWMKNKPQRKRSRSVSAEEAISGIDVQEPISFPGPQPIPAGQIPGIPVPLSPHGTARNLDQELEKQNAAVNGEDEEGGGSVEGLKQQHLQRWKTIKSRWMASSLSEQHRYRDSLKILKDMFQR